MAFGLIAIAPMQGLVYTILALLGGLTLRFLGYGFVEGIALTLGADVHVERYPAGGAWLIFCPSKRLEGRHHSLYESV